MAATMTALFGGTGPHWTPRQVPLPEPGPRQIVVRARAVALNNADAAMLAAADPTAGGTGEEYQAGFEFTGEVTAVGDGVTRPAELGAVVAAAGEALLPAVADARVRPVLDSTFTFDTADQAVERLRSHQAHGKTVLAVP
ncbi:zinc-binding dehydrogenase [Streptomyces sp. NPDC053780]|uniref:zinc-binding dehydrogenase n=1 Tax=unclassified Streptomyces TaxID=2593676 RepID=UPI003419914F